MASPTVAAAVDQLPNINSLDQFRSLVNSLDVSAKPGPYILYSGSFPELPDAAGNPTGAGAIANNLAQQMGASTIDQTPRAQFLSDPATTARFQQLATDAGLDPKTAYSQQFFSNDNAFWREASQKFVASTDGEGFAITGSQTRANPIMVTDEIPTALANPNSQFLPANQPNVAAALSSGDEAQVRAALAQSTQNSLTAGDIVRDPSGTFAISQEGLTKIGVTAPAPLSSAADLSASGFQPVAPVDTSVAPSTVTASPSADTLPPTAHSAGEPILGSPATADAQPPSTHIQTLPDNAPSIVPEMPRTPTSPTEPGGTPTASGTSSEAIPPNNGTGLAPETSAAPVGSQVTGAPDMAAPNSGNPVALAPEAPAPAPGTAAAAPEAPTLSMPATGPAPSPTSQAPAIAPDNAPTGAPTGADLSPSTASPDVPGVGTAPAAPDVAPSGTVASPAPEAPAPAPGTAAAVPEAPTLSTPATGPAQSPTSQAPTIAPDNAPTGAPTGADLSPSTASPNVPVVGTAPEAPGSVSGSATGRFLPGFAATIAESPAATTILRGAGAVGALGAAADAGITGYNAYQLYNHGDTVGAGREVTGFGGRLGGALSGAWALGELGAVGGPWGALGGALVGGVTGAVLGDKAVKGIYDYLTGYQPPQSSNTSQPTPGFPDQFAAQFDTANGGGPYSDPATGMQLETQAQYDARKQAYVDQQMTNQQAQAQQFLDTLNPLGSNDTNTGNGIGSGAGNQGFGSPTGAGPGAAGAPSNANQTNSDQTNIAPGQGTGQPDSTQTASPTIPASGDQSNQTGPTLASDASAPAAQPGGSGASDTTAPSDTASATPSSIPSLASAPTADVSTSTEPASTSGPSADNSSSVGASPSNPSLGSGAPDLTAATTAPMPTPDAAPPAPIPAPAPAPDVASPSPAPVAAPTPTPDAVPPAPTPAPAPVPDIASPSPAPVPAPAPAPTPTPSPVPDLSATSPITPDLLSPTPLSLTPTPLTPPSLSDPSLSSDPLAPTSSIDSGLSTPSSSLDTGSSLSNSLTLNPGGDSNLTLTPSVASSSSLDSSLGSGLDSTSSLGSSGFDAGGGFSDGGGGGDAGPVVLDLSGQGVRLTDMRSSTATFDVNGNGVQDRIAWATPGEGILAYDPTGASTVNNINQIELSRWSPGAKTDLQGLAAFDANHDGQLDAGDPAFSQFRIWTDSNGSGTGNLETLVEAGVKSISLTSDGARTNLPDGSIIYGQGTFTRTDGTTGKLGDVALAYSPDVNAARDQLAGALASAPAQPSGNVTAPPPPPSAPPPMLAADPHHALPGSMR